jgi:hypothetical protein
MSTESKLSNEDIKKESRSPQEIAKVASAALVGTLIAAGVCGMQEKDYAPLNNEVQTTPTEQVENTGLTDQEHAELMNLQAEYEKGPLNAFDAQKKAELEAKERASAMPNLSDRNLGNTHANSTAPYAK